MSRGKMTLKTTVTMTVVYDELAKSNIAQPKISFFEARVTVAISCILLRLELPAGPALFAKTGNRRGRQRRRRHADSTAGRAIINN